VVLLAACVAVVGIWVGLRDRATATRTEAVGDCVAGFVAGVAAGGDAWPGGLTAPVGRRVCEAVIERFGAGAGASASAVVAVMREQGASMLRPLCDYVAEHAADGLSVRERGGVSAPAARAFGDGICAHAQQYVAEDGRVRFADLVRDNPRHFVPLCVEGLAIGFAGAPELLPAAPGARDRALGRICRQAIAAGVIGVDDSLAPWLDEARLVGIVEAELGITVADAGPGKL
jgi:hypothetical protein